MPASYCAYVQGSFVTTGDNLAIEIDAAANVTLKIKRIRIMHNDGTATASSDYYHRIKLITESAGGTGGSSFTPIPINSNSTASTATVKTGLTAVGTIDKTIDTMSIHNTTDFEWKALDEDDKITIKPGSLFGIVVKPS